MRSIGQLVVAVALGSALAGCTVHAVAPAPTPNVIARGRLKTPYVIGRLAAPREEVCSVHEGLRDICVGRFHDAFESGLNTLLSSYMPGPDAARAVYTAEFQLVEFLHSPTSTMQSDGMVQIQVALRWQFVLRDPSGEAVVKVAETTVGPLKIVHIGATEQAIGQLVNTTLERIGTAMNGGPFWTTPATAEGGT